MAIVRILKILSKKKNTHIYEYYHVVMELSVNLPGQQCYQIILVARNSSYAPVGPNWLSLSETLSVATVTRPTDWIGAENGADESFA